jgi:uncharacterized protein YndB with AHSA1/START domain
MTSLTLVRRIKAPPAVVFELLSTAEGLTSWWGPDDLPILTARADVRVGGDFRVRFRTNDGLEHECAGQFLDIVAPERIVMSWRWTSGGEQLEQDNISRVELHLRPIDQGTELTLIHAALLGPGSPLNHEGGWRGALDKMEFIFNQLGEESDAHGV